MDGVEDIYPLTPTQAGMLFQCLRDGDPELYFEQVRADLRGHLDVERIERAFQVTTQRHTALRTAILWDGLEQPLQAVLSDVDLTIEILHRPGIDDAGLDRLAEKRRQIPFDLQRAPLQRLALVQADDRSHLIWEFHHIVCDGWSAAVVLDEMLAIYQETLGPEPPAPFRDFIAWHSTRDLEATNAYWKQLLDGLSSPTPLALPRTTQDTKFLAGRWTETIAGAPLDELVRFARSRRVTQSTLVQAAWSIVQARYSGSDEVVFGVTTSGRPADLPGVENSVGMFLNTLPMRANVGPDQPIEEFLLGLQEQQLASTEHATTSLAELHRQAGFKLGEDMFDTMLVFENFPRPANDPSAQLVLSNKTVFEQTNYPLTLMIGMDDGELRLVANYDRNRFADEAIGAVMAQFSHVLAGLTRPDVVTLSQIDFFTAEDEETFRQWQGRHLQIDMSATVISMLLDVAAAHPDGVALIDADSSLTFSQLLSRGQVVAERLIELGVGPEVPVAICIPRRIDMVVAVVGTLLAGGVYVPLDPRFPPARLDLMLDVSAAEIVLTTIDVEHSVPVRDGTNILVMDLLGTNPIAAPDRAALRAGPHNTMVLAFTSGSTGVPKGVRIQHTGSLHRLSWQWSRYPIEHDEVFAQKTTLGFMDHNWELWGGLLKGRPVLLLDDDTVKDLDRFIDALAAHPVRRLSLVPSLLDLMVDHAPDLATRLPKLRTWTVSGEALSVATADRFAAVMPHARLLNFYGMSEATQDATYAEIVPGSSDVPIGRPMDNFEIQLLDSHSRRVPVGIAGELHVSGIGLSPGYWRRPDLTAERFVRNPSVLSASSPHAIMYRSGDIARWRFDGVLEYLGRADHQVKVRGVRIELGEVETAIASHPSVERAVVVGRTTANGTELIGYVVGVGTSADSNAERILRHVALHLPEAMVPSHLVHLAEFPLLPNGKVDRSALPAPVRKQLFTPSQGLLSGAEQQMLTVWRTVMDDPTLGPDDDFFDRGGHSMMAMRLVSRIKRDLDFAVPLAQLLRAGTVRSLTAALATIPPDRGSLAPDEVQYRHIVPLREPDPVLRNVFVVHGAGGDVLNLRPLSAHLDGLANVIGLQAAGVDGVSEFHSSTQDMVDDYLGEIRGFQPEGPYLIAGFSIGGVIAVELARSLQHGGQKVDRVVLFDVFHPSVQARTLTMLERLAYVRTEGWDYRVEQLVHTWRKFVGNRWKEWRLDRVVRRRNRFNDSIPFELRKAEITENAVRLWLGHSPHYYGGRVLLLSADHTYDVWDHVPRHREWEGRVHELDVVNVPGNHLTLVEEPHVGVLARRLSDALGLRPARG